MNGSVIIVSNYEAPRQRGEEIILKRAFFVWEPFLRWEYLDRPGLVLLQVFLL